MHLKVPTLSITGLGYFSFSEIQAELEHLPNLRHLSANHSQT